MSSARAPHRRLTSRSSLESVRRQAKRWLKQITAGDSDAIARFMARAPNRPNPTFREVQHALALDYNYSNWVRTQAGVNRFEAGATYLC